GRGRGGAGRHVDGGHPGAGGGAHRAAGLRGQRHHARGVHPRVDPRPERVHRAAARGPHLRHRRGHLADARRLRRPAERAADLGSRRLPDDAPRGGGEAAVTYRSQRIAWWYFLAAILLFALQVAFGFLSLAKYLGPDPLRQVLNFATTKSIHTNLLLVWNLTGFMGAAYYMVPEESRTEIHSERLAIWQLILWLALGVTAIVGYLFGWTAG